MPDSFNALQVGYWTINDEHVLSPEKKEKKKNTLGNRVKLNENVCKVCQVSTQPFNSFAEDELLNACYRTVFSAMIRR